MLIGQHIDKWMSVNEKELLWLHDTAKRMNSIVEIGSCKGRSTYALCSSGCKMVYAIDDFEMSPATQHDFTSNLLGFNNITLLKMKSCLAAQYFDKVDMVFIDGNHEYEEVMKDLELWTPKATKFLAGHDYRTDVTWTQVAPAVNDFFKKEPKRFEDIWYYEL